MRFLLKLVVRLSVLLTALTMQGCGYYYQAAKGHMDLMSERRSIDSILQDPAAEDRLKERLAMVLEARSFASDRIGLPANDSYTTYVELDRQYVVWNVFAAPEFSVQAKRWCFPVAGCVVYRGYFREEKARAYADGLADKGWDVHVGGVAAYSTLGRFDDPVLSSMMRWEDTQLVALLFHELAHQQLYVKDDSEFNESFASAVEQEGLYLWLAAREEVSGFAQYRENRERASAFNLLVGATRNRLLQLYDSDLPAEEMRLAKQGQFDQLRSAYQAQKTAWGGYGGYDHWFDDGLNNARLVPVTTYRRFVPAFRALFRDAGSDFEAFYGRCDDLARMTIDKRHARLNELMLISPVDRINQ
jgi:predicted aminopeptidase